MNQLHCCTDTVLVHQRLSRTAKTERAVTAEQLQSAICGARNREFSGLLEEVQDPVI